MVRWADNKCTNIHLSSLGETHKSKLNDVKNALDKISYENC